MSDFETLVKSVRFTGGGIHEPSITAVVGQ
jgi:hypothetical protein